MYMYNKLIHVFGCLLQFRTQGHGELLVSLCYQPAANRLTVVVLKARNLPKMDITGLSGTFHIRLWALAFT